MFPTVDTPHGRNHICVVMRNERISMKIFLVIFHGWTLPGFAPQALCVDSHNCTATGKSGKTKVQQLRGAALQGYI